jgi:chaperone modulatory protein CbpM
VKSLEEVLGELGGVERTEVMAWVEERWVQPDPDEGGRLRFSAVDVARLRLIHELRHELAIEPEAMPVVLSLIDEMYGARMRLVLLARALADLPAEVRTRLSARCQALLREIEAGEGPAAGQNPPET